MMVSRPELFSEAKKYLTGHQSDLVNDVEIILGRLKVNDNISDFSFLVSPIAKSYEGYLKDFFLKIGIISNQEYESDHFRVGKTLNPSLRYKRFSVYQKLSDYDDKGEELAEILWDAWKFGRNEIFHYFPNNYKNLSRNEAEDRINLLLRAIIQAGNFLDNNKKQSF
ncbi:hypothetical protein KBC13_02355 [Candidatus Shapirobacteria bacterium]|jgi:hypothetical protein|nr:hypothetical protein [Candidatus Shapirobacteria bacterium]